MFARWQCEEPELSTCLNGEGRLYLEYHAARYARLLKAVLELTGRAGTGHPLHVLDVGPNIQTALLRTVDSEAIVDTLGFAHPAVPPRADERHVDFDLNDCLDRALWPQLPRQYDVIIMAEVLEHLHVPPHTVLGFLREQLRRPGFVVLQTPNAAALHKRLALLMGRNPVEAPRSSRENPGHFHEYTLRELRDQVSAGGLTVDWLRSENYFGSGLTAELYWAAGHVLPATWRHGVTVCARACD